MKTFFWIDLEMTGLDEKVDRILEVAVVVTDKELNRLEEYHRIVFQPEEVLKSMNEWCKKTHGESGLTKAVATGTPIEEVEKELLALVKRHYASGDRVVLAGNSVGNDKRFVDAYWPELAKRLHYRIIDVSSFKEVFREKYSIGFEKKANAHRALDDVYESIEELKFYLSFVKIPEAPKAEGKTNA